MTCPACGGSHLTTYLNPLTGKFTPCGCTPLALCGAGMNSDAMLPLTCERPVGHLGCHWAGDYAWKDLPGLGPSNPFPRRWVEGHPDMKTLPSWTTLIHDGPTDCPYYYDYCRCADAPVMCLYCDHHKDTHYANPPTVYEGIREVDMGCSAEDDGHPCGCSGFAPYPPEGFDPDEEIE